METYLHIPGRVACHPFGVHPDHLLRVAVQSNGTEVNPICEKRIPEQILDTIEGVAVEEEHWFLGGMPSEGNTLELPLGYGRQHLDSASQVLGCTERDPGLLDLRIEIDE